MPKVEVVQEDVQEVTKEDANKAAAQTSGEVGVGGMATMKAPDAELEAALQDKMAAKKSAVDNYWEREAKEIEERAKTFETLSEKYGKTLLALSVAYIHASMKQDTVVSPEDLACIEQYQDSVYLMAAATLCSTGRY